MNTFLIVLSVILLVFGIAMLGVTLFYLYELKKVGEMIKLDDVEWKDGIVFGETDEEDSNNN